MENLQLSLRRTRLEDLTRIRLHKDGKKASFSRPFSAQCRGKPGRKHDNGLAQRAGNTQVCTRESGCEFRQGRQQALSRGKQLGTGTDGSRRPIVLFPPEQVSWIAIPGANGKRKMRVANGPPSPRLRRAGPGLRQGYGVASEGRRNAGEGAAGRSMAK
jgi:hypothetical protein